MQNPSFFARKGVFAGETFAGFPPLFYKSRRRRAICSANRKCSKKKHHPSGWCFFLERATRLELASRHPTNCVPQFAETLPHLCLKCASRMGVGIEFFPSNEKNQGIQIGCPDLLWSVLTKKMRARSFVPQGFAFARLLRLVFRFAIRTPSIL